MGCPPSVSMIPSFAHTWSPSSKMVYRTEPPAPLPSLGLAFTHCWTRSRPSFSFPLTGVNLDEFLYSLNLNTCETGITVPSFKACFKDQR